MKDALTLLHISDLGFGPEHAFGSPAANDYGTLAGRIAIDVQDLGLVGELRPQVVLVSGDLTHSALPAQLNQFELFLKQLSTALMLPVERVAVVPGDCDVSYPLCRAYFAEQEGLGEVPESPYARKWRPFQACFRRLYPGMGEPSDFSEEQPWALLVYQELELVVAGLNSTWAETHEVHRGELGERQIRWFQDRLREYPGRRWFRVGLLHHEVMGTLQDRRLFERHLAGHLDLVLHGESRPAGAVEWLGAKTPILGAGQAGRKGSGSCQYQILRVHAGGLDRLLRCWDSQGRWVADASMAAAVEVGWASGRFRARGTPRLGEGGSSDTEPEGEGAPMRAPPPDGHQEGSGNPDRELYDFLLAAFDLAGLQELVWSNYPELTASLPAGSVSLAGYARELVAALRRHGRIDAMLFAGLEEKRPFRSHEIQELRGRLGIR